MTHWLLLPVKSAIVGSALIATLPASAIGILLGNGTLSSPNDLTRIQVGASVLEFLDVSVTVGNTVASAITTYSVNGFRWANGGDVGNLFSAFGFAYASVPGSGVNLITTAAQRINFVSYVGSGNQALGWIDDLTTASFHTYACIGTGGVTCEAFVTNTTSFWPTWPSVGVYLVRTAPVPEPSAYLLFALGLVALNAFCFRSTR